jgi:hypothetical protein
LANSAAGFAPAPTGAASAAPFAAPAAQGAKLDGKAAKDTTAAPKAPKAKREAKKRDGLSGLDAAAKVLVLAGRQYVGIARNHRPDHLAILPDLKGSCSIADGAGLCRNHDVVEEAMLAPSMAC